MATKRAPFTIKFRDKKGRFTSSAGQAQSYEVYRGKRKEIENTKFTKRQKTAKQKRVFSEKLITKLEIKRDEDLERRRIKRQREAKKKLKEIEKKEKEKKEKEKIEVEGIIEIPPEKLKRYKIHDIQQELLDKQYPNLERARFEEPQTLRQATVEFVHVIPYSPQNDYYRKEVISKTILSNEKVLDLNILKLELTKNHWLKVTEDTLKSVSSDAFAYFGVHLENFFNDAIKNNTDFIFRIKFKVQRTETTFEDMAISGKRTELRTLEDLIGLFVETFTMMTESGQGNNYLAGLANVYISGFTLEAS